MFTCFKNNHILKNETEKGKVKIKNKNNTTYPIMFLAATQLTAARHTWVWVTTQVPQVGTKESPGFSIRLN
jgi:hypothetical protein